MLDPVGVLSAGAVPCVGWRRLVRGTAIGALLAELRTLNSEMHALCGGVDQGGYFGALMARIDLTNRLLSEPVGSAVTGAAESRKRSELGAFY